MIAAKFLIRYCKSGRQARYEGPIYALVAAPTRNYELFYYLEFVAMVVSRWQKTLGSTGPYKFGQADHLELEQLQGLIGFKDIGKIDSVQRSALLVKVIHIRLALVRQYEARLDQKLVLSQGLRIHRL